MAIIRIHLRMKRYKEKVSKTIDVRMQKYVKQTINAGYTLLNPLHEERAKEIMLNFIKYYNTQRMMINKFAFYVSKTMIF